MNRHRFARTAALGLALAALAAPTASAKTVDLRSQAGTSSLAGTTSPAPNRDARDAAQTAAARHGQPQQDLRSPDTRDYAEGRGTFSAPEVTVVKVTEPSPPSAGLDWGDAGIGAGSMLGLILLAVGSSLAVVHRKQAAAAGQPAITA